MCQEVVLSSDDLGKKRAKSNESNDLCFHHQYFNEMVDLDLVFILSLIISGIFLKNSKF